MGQGVQLPSPANTSLSHRYKEAMKYENYTKNAFEGKIS